MNTWLKLLAAAALAFLLAACGTSSQNRAGGYYMDDGPGSDIPPDIASLPDAVPRIEPHARANSRPYYVMGRTYTPIVGSQPFKQEGVASWYGRKFHGQRTANGERYDMYAMTAAHPTLPLPSYARVTRLDNGKSVVVRVNDRGPFLHSRVIDLSYAAAAKLGYINHGSARVRVEAITHDEIRQAQRGGATTLAVQDTPAPDVAAPPPLTTLTPAPMPTTPDAMAAMPSQAVASDFTTPQTLPVSASPDIRSAPVPATGPPIGNTDQIYLQYGAFSAITSAQGLAQQLNAQLGPIESRSAHIQQANGLHRVRIGPYPNRTEAVNAALRIQQHTGQQATIALQ